MSPSKIILVSNSKASNKMKTTNLLLCCLFSLSLFSQNTTEPKFHYPNTILTKCNQITVATLKDIDNNVYSSIQIGDQIWMVENLNVSHYRNGDPIPMVKVDSLWENLTTGAYCYYDNNPSYEKKLGKLYNFYAVADERNIAPVGWHIPTDEEWTILKDYLIAKGYNLDETTSGNTLGKAMSATSGWVISTLPGTPGCESEKNNRSNFNALPGSFRSIGGVYIFPMGNSANFWTSTPNNEKFAWNRYIANNICQISRDAGRKTYGLSVRCIKGEMPSQKTQSETTVTDIDKNSYKTLKYGTQTWMVENLKVTHYQNGDVIPMISNDKTWESLNSGAYCFYENDPKNGEKFGNLYNFYAVVDPRNIAPKGWHVATDEDWTKLKKFLISNAYNADGTTVGNNICKSMAGNSDWILSTIPDVPGYNLPTNNKSKFNALPGSFRSTGGVFAYPIGSSANFWSASENNEKYAWNRYLSNDLSHISRDAGRKSYGLSVRCVKNE